jgi:hypothetical protein
MSSLNNDRKTESFYQHFVEYIDDYFDFGIYRPFYHGTTAARAKIILKKGLLRRIDAPGEKDVSKNKWESESIESLPDRVYFITCTERSGIAKTACMKALEFEQKPAEHCVFLELVNYEKYKDNFVIDEDSRSLPEQMKRFFSEKSYPENKISDAVSSMKLLHRIISKFYERGFVIGGGELVSRMIDITPSAIFSICDWGTFAIKSSVAPEDLKAVSLDVYNKRENCRERTGYADIDSDLYYGFARHHDEENAISFKKVLSLTFKRE